MKNRKFLSQLLFVLIFITSCNNKEEIGPSYEKEFFENQAYGNKSRNSMDVAVPKERQHERPILLFLHGGAWLTGDKSTFSDAIKDFADQGYLAASMNYRLASLNSVGNRHPAQMEDIQNAITYLLNESANWDLNPEKIILTGHSAGGHLSLLFAYDYDDQDKVIGVYSMAGPVNLIDPNFLNIPNVEFGIQNYLGQSLEGDTALWKSASPYYVVHEDAPPTFLIHGKRDGLVPYTQVESFKQRLDSLDISNEFILYENDGHDVHNGPNKEETFEALEEWLPTLY